MLIDAADAASDLLLFLILAKARFQQITVSIQDCYAVVDVLARTPMSSDRRHFKKSDDRF